MTEDLLHAYEASLIRTLSIPWLRPGYGPEAVHARPDTELKSLVLGPHIGITKSVLEKEVLF